jgi:hypothetical protein
MNEVKIDGKDSACSMQAAFAGAGGDRVWSLMLTLEEARVRDVQ